MFFSVPLPSNFDTINDFIKSLKAEESEVVSFEACRVADLDDIEDLPLAFESARFTLKKFIGD